ncbi:MAG: thioredoxin family protein [Bacillota bacterium]|uniref:Thioredoxin family protein n=1 Tax=Virgibacillus salarius TaxID=447199 RepID=A0A941DVV5_9BACI|nr:MULTISPECIES: thioredoxin family protein [Bacillaceae]NAZ10444.1 thiol reductase thioredoxin [Agaribacter marinus]MBR7797735.1 thioredoxin family protein [Virgibacillus salarius]MCC2250108.1 thioredoxin family protein [Virgibacillus sp. AGTR]MDY7046245.1 thioredoxin family protein [Virgibacillus sp. M23]QRZ17743.1 thioredoxin family protein [Virgibacillus sp. AGTR]
METLASQEEFKKWIKQENVILYFTAGWCPDCTVIEPVLPEIEAEFPSFSFVKVDRDKFIDICQDYAIFGIPSFIAFNDGKETGRFVSKDRKTKQEIIEFLKEVSDK